MTAIRGSESLTKVELSHKAVEVAMLEVKRQDIFGQSRIIFHYKCLSILHRNDQGEA